MLFASPFFRRLFIPYLLLLWTGICAVGMFGAVRLRESYLENVTSSLKHQSQLVAELALEKIDSGDVKGVQELIRHIGENVSCRVTLINAEGVVVADNESEPTLMDNHRYRPEVVTASELGDGKSIRQSDTLHTELLYFAHRFKSREGRTYYVRLASHFVQLDRSLRELYATLAVVAALAMVGTGMVSYFHARRQTAPLLHLESLANSVSNGNLNARILQPSKDEMGSVASCFNTMSESVSRLLEQAGKDKSELTAILESMSEGIIAVNLKKHILVSNDAAGRLFGFTPSESLDKSLWEIVRDVEILKKTNDIDLNGGKSTLTVEISARKLEVTISAYPASGPAEGIVIVAHDVTESSRFQELRREFVANVSHELRTPLTAIRGFVETLLDGAMKDPLKGPQFLATVQKHTDQLSNLVNDLLELSRLDSLPSLPRQQQIDVASIMRRAAELLASAAEQKKHTITILSPSHLPTVSGNPDYLERAIANLLENAIKYTHPNGHVRLSVKEEGRQVLIEVTDDGIGIPQADLDRIFERFYRVDRSRSRGMGGTGLGLSIVKHVAQVHGGSVEVTSSPGQGSTFRLRFPVAAQFA